MVIYRSLLVHASPAFFRYMAEMAVSAARESGYGSYPMPAAWIWEEKGLFSVQILLLHEIYGSCALMESKSSLSLLKPDK